MTIRFTTISFYACEWERSSGAYLKGTLRHVRSVLSFVSRTFSAEPLSQCPKSKIRMGPGLIVQYVSAGPLETVAGHYPVKNLSSKWVEQAPLVCDAEMTGRMHTLG